MTKKSLKKSHCFHDINYYALLSLTYLGAIDIDLFNLSNLKPDLFNEKRLKFYGYVTNEGYVKDFSVILINEYAIPFFFSSLDLENRASFATQSLIEFISFPNDINCVEKYKSTELYTRYWSKINSIAQNFLDSSFCIKTQGTKSEFKNIFHEGMEYKIWLDEFSGHMIYILENSKCDLFKLFFGCESLIKINSDFANFILPYIIINVINYNTEIFSFLEQEINNIIKAILPDNDLFFTNLHGKKKLTEFKRK